MPARRLGRVPVDHELAIEARQNLAGAASRQGEPHARVLAFGTRRLQAANGDQS